MSLLSLPRSFLGLAPARSATYIESLSSGKIYAILAPSTDQASSDASVSGKGLAGVSCVRGLTSVFPDLGTPRVYGRAQISPSAVNPTSRIRLREPSLYPPLLHTRCSPVATSYVQMS